MLHPLLDNSSRVLLQYQMLSSIHVGFICDHTGCSDISSNSSDNQT